MIQGVTWRRVKRRPDVYASLSEQNENIGISFCLYTTKPMYRFFLQLIFLQFFHFQGNEGGNWLQKICFMNAVSLLNSRRLRTNYVMTQSSHYIHFHIKMIRLRIFLFVSVCNKNWKTEDPSNIFSIQLILPIYSLFNCHYQTLMVSLMCQNTRILCYSLEFITGKLTKETPCPNLYCNHHLRL